MFVDLLLAAAVIRLMIRMDSVTRYSRVQTEDSCCTLYYVCWCFTREATKIRPRKSEIAMGYQPSKYVTKPGA
jgi:hypothetical protein